MSTMSQFLEDWVPVILPILVGGNAEAHGKRPS
jgi:hypothetical protein